MAGRKRQVLRGLSPIKNAFTRIFHPSLQTVRTPSATSNRLSSHSDGGGGGGEGGRRLRCVCVGGGGKGGHVDQELRSFSS